MVVPLALVAGPGGTSVASADEQALSRVHIRIDGAPDGRGFAVEFTAAVAAPAANVAAALADMATYPAWVPRVRAVRPIAPEADSEATAAFDSTIGLPWPVGDVHEQVAMSREDEGGEVRMRWDHVRGDMRRNAVVWTVTPIDAEHTAVRYEARLWFKGWLPVFLLRLAERDYAPWFVDCLERRAAALGSAAEPPQQAARNVVTPRSSL